MKKTVDPSPKKGLRPGRAKIVFVFESGRIEVAEGTGKVDQPLRDAIERSCKRFFAEYPSEEEKP